jgi:hypothetical protein
MRASISVNSTVRLQNCLLGKTFPTFFTPEMAITSIKILNYKIFHWITISDQHNTWIKE